MKASRYPVLAALAALSVSTCLLVSAIAAGLEHKEPVPPASAPSPALASSQGQGASLVRFPEKVRSGPATPVVMTAALSHNGEVVPVACSTCHTTRPPDLSNKSGEQMNEFHQGLAYKHGEQSCLSCHNAANYDTLRKADGTALPYPRTQELCAQCHGPQYRDYKAGAHGGMNGFWDRSKGPRERNTCTDCHDPHSPAFPKMSPVFPPQDRGARQQVERNAKNEGASHAGH